MEIEDDPDISLSIPLKSLYEELCCPICFNPIKDCFITPCAIVNTEKDEASKKYFEKLFNGQNPGNDNKPNNTNPNEPSSKVEKKLSPIEEVFHKHIKKSLMAYEDYYQELEKKHDKNMDTVKTFFVKKVAEVSNNSKSKNEVDQQVALLTAECEFKVKELQESFKESVSLLTAAYEKYMETSLPTPSFLPVSVSISIPSKKLVWKKYIVKPTDTLNEIKEYVAKKLEESNNPIVDYYKDSKWVIRRGVSAMNIDESLNQNVTQITNANLPLLQYELHQNEEICLLGDVQLKSDMPKKCFSATFEKGKEANMDYYTCKDCKINWVCKPCAESCHKGHSISEYIMNHKATWACCYCAKNKKCSLINK